MFQSLVNLGDGRVIGRNSAKFWGNDTDANGIRESLQTLQPIGSSEFTQLEAIFKNWNSWTIDLPGAYYLEVIEKLYRRNELATEVWSRWDKRSTSRACGFQCFFLPAAPTKWLLRNNCLQRNGW